MPSNHINQNTEGCCNKHDGPSDRVTDHPAIDKLHRTMVRHVVGQCPSYLSKQPPEQYT